MKRIICFLLTVLLLSTPVLAGGVAGSSPENGVSLDWASPEKFNEMLGLTEQQYESFRETVYSATRRCLSSCNVSAYNIKYSYDVNTFLQYVITKGDPESFHVSYVDFTVSGNGSSIKITQIKFYYKIAKVIYDQMREEAVAVADMLLDGIEDNDALTDVQKALLLHDRLAVHCEYNEEGLYNSTIGDDDLSMYGALVNRICV